MHYIHKLALIIFTFILFGLNNTLVGQTLVWQENFDSTALNTNLWTYDNGDGCERNLCGWGNAELQHYTNRPENIRVENGNLIIEARRENYGTRSFTSGRIKTEGRVHIKYGTIEARIKIPNLANGLWPAFWTLGTIGPSWPAIGEMDIMEMGSQSARLAGLINRQVSSATHWSNNGVKDIRGSSTNASVNLNDDYHLYKLVWTQQSIKMFLDGTLILEQDITNSINGTEEFHQPHFLLLNVAIGGAYTGLLNPSDITKIMPAKMYVDYVKVYQNPGDEIAFNRFNTTSGNFGVLTETTSKTDSITLGTNATLNYWNNLTAISNAVPYEGNQVIAVRANPGNWFGLGIDNKYINLSDHIGGSMKFHCKTTHQGLFKIGLRSADGESWITFPANSSTYGLIRDGNWHEVTIPLSAFNNPSTANYIDYVAVKYSFMLVGDAPLNVADFYFDNIYFNKNAAVTPTLGTFSVPSKVLGQPAFSLTPPTSNSAGSFSYSSSNAAVATVSGNTVTLTGAGSATITATQSSSGIYGSASVSATLVVTMPTLNTAAPTPPARNAADVISLYSNAYANISGIDWFPNWGQSTIATDVLIQGNQTRKYENLNYQGVQFSGAVNAATMAFLHIDIWTPNCNTFNVFLINTTPTLKEQKVALTPSNSGWNSFDIPMTSYDLITLSSIQQMKFDCTPFGSSLVYFDNLYFWKTSNAPIISGFSIPTKFLGDAPFTITTPTSNSNGTFSYTSSNSSVATVSGSIITIVGVGTTTITATQAAAGVYSSGTATTDLLVSFPVPSVAAPNPPARNNSDRISIFSNAYSNLATTDFNPFWGQTTVVTDVNIAGNATKKFEQFNYQGIQLATSNNFSNMQKLHIDLWTPNVTAFDIYLINTSPSLFEQKVTLNPSASGWNSFDIPLTQFPQVNLSNITQFKMTGTPTGSGVVYWDNLYFWKDAALTAPAISITQPGCTNSGGTVTVTSSTTGLTFSINGVNYTNTNGVFSGLAAGNYSLTAKDANGNISPATTFTILSNTSLPAPVTEIIGVRNINQCDTLQLYRISNALSGLNYIWSVTGTGNRIISGQGNDSVYLSLKSAGIISVVASNTCGNSTSFSLSVLKAIPLSPTALTATGTNVCNYTQSAFAITGVRDTFRTRSVAGATGYYFETPGGATVQRLNDTTITVLFADTTTATSVKVYSLSSCDTSLSRVIALTRTLLAAPTAITITSVQPNVCGARKYRYSAPALPAGALGYEWLLEGSLAEFATIDSGDINSRTIVVNYASNSASAAGDSIRLYYTTGCGYSRSRAIKMSNTALRAPAAPTSITIQSIQTNVCGARKYRYIAPVLPAATATSGVATGYVWSFVGSLSSTMTIDSGSLTSRILTVTFTSNAAAGLDSVRVLYTSGCGNSLRRASKLSNLALGAPAAPATVTIQTKSDVCGARKYRYIAPVLSSATATAGAASGYLWTLPTGTVGSTGSLDSGSLSGRTIVIVYTSNAAATTDSIRVRYTSGCGNSAIKAQKLSNVAKACLTSGTDVFSRVSPNVTSEVEIGKVYPNPNNGTFILHARTGVISKSTATVQVIDMMGKVVSHTLVEMNQGIIYTTINNNLKNGVYLVKYIAGNTTQTIRMVVQKINK